MPLIGVGQTKNYFIARLRLAGNNLGAEGARADIPRGLKPTGFDERVGARDEFSPGNKGSGWGFGAKVKNREAAGFVDGEDATDQAIGARTEGLGGGRCGQGGSLGAGRDRLRLGRRDLTAACEK